MAKLTIQTDPQLWETVKEFGGFKDNVALINEALTFLKWTLEKTADNKTVGSLNEETYDFTKLAMDCIEYAKPETEVKNAIKPATETLAELMKRLNQSTGGKSRIFQIDPAKERNFTKLVDSGGFESGHAAINEAVRGLSWALGEVYQGHTVGSVDLLENRFIELSLPSLDYVAKNRPQTTPSRPALKPPEGGDHILWSEWIKSIRKNPPDPDKERE